MTLLGDIYRGCIPFLLLSGVSSSLCAQNVAFSAAAKSNKICTHEKVQVQYTINDAHDMRSMTRPSDTDFIIVGGPYEQQNNSTTFRGNTVSHATSITVTYVMMPKREGIFIIPPVTAKDGSGHSYQSNAVIIQVINPPQLRSAALR